MGTPAAESLSLVLRALRRPEWGSSLSVVQEVLPSPVPASSSSSQKAAPPTGSAPPRVDSCPVEIAPLPRPPSAVAAPLGSDVPCGRMGSVGDTMTRKLRLPRGASRTLPPSEEAPASSAMSSLRLVRTTGDALLAAASTARAAASPAVCASDENTPASTTGRAGSKLTSPWGQRGHTDSATAEATSARGSAARAAPVPPSGARRQPSEPRSRAGGGAVRRRAPPPSASAARARASGGMS
mmetsp:Transcript_2226/g.8573  ORF Transcript_2226/g.8573 Transcript_2226/m.8573 type:complete len:240 (-) Transcript_2226:2377-3096(-)